MEMVDRSFSPRQELDGLLLGEQRTSHIQHTSIQQESGIHARLTVNQTSVMDHQVMSVDFDC